MADNIFKLLLEGTRKTRERSSSDDKLKSILNNQESMDYKNRKSGQKSNDLLSDFDDFSIGEEREKVDYLSDIDKLSMKELDKKTSKEQLKILKLEYNRLYDKLNSLNKTITSNERLISDIQMERREEERQIQQMKDLIRKIVHLFPGQRHIKDLVDRGNWDINEVFDDIEEIVRSVLAKLKEMDTFIESEVGKYSNENTVLKQKILQYKEYVAKIEQLEQMILSGGLTPAAHQNVTLNEQMNDEVEVKQPQASPVEPEIVESQEEVHNETTSNDNSAQPTVSEHNPHFQSFFNEFTTSVNRMKDEETNGKTTTPPTPSPAATPQIEKKVSPSPIQTPVHNPISDIAPNTNTGTKKHPLSPDYVETEKQEVEDLFDSNIEEYIQNLSAQQEFVLTTIGKTGISRNPDLKEFLKDDPMGQNFYVSGKKFNYTALSKDVSELRDKGILSDQQVNYGGKGGGSIFIVYELSKVGKACFKMINDDNPVVPEKKRIVDLHASLEHGYLIKDSAKLFQEMNYKVYTDLDDVSFKIDKNHRKVFDFIVENDEGKLMYIEVERGTHTQEGFSNAMDKIYQITKEFYFICPNDTVKNKETKKKFFTWITKTLGGIKNADVILNMTTIEQLRKKPKNVWEVTDLRNIK
ncbi:hypothetical protein [Bacillus toyonensis]|uniref:hypothetical protein n=1 Tax=Bacillus toyonensis TaxID=155322 RepID=UPI002E1BA1B5|nr:hypothetical protein [Bacillus toyonensis]